MGIIIQYKNSMLSVLFSVLYVLSVGFFTLRADARIDGVSLDWQNQPVEVIGGGSPWLYNLAVTCLSGALFFWLLRKPRNNLPAKLSPAVSALIVLTIFILWFAVTTDYSVQPLMIGEPLARINPLFAWAQAGALNPAVHVLTAFLVVFVVMTLAKNKDMLQSSQRTTG